MRRDILIHPDPRLKKPCAPVPAVTEDIRALGRDLLETMYHAPGIGLAAPQVGVNLRVIAMDWGRGLWAANGDRTPWLIEGGKGTKPLAAHFQLRPDPLAH